MAASPVNGRMQGAYNAAYESYGNEMQARGGDYPCSCQASNYSTPSYNQQLPPMAMGMGTRKKEPITYTWKNLNVYGGLQGVGGASANPMMDPEKGFQPPSAVPNTKHILKNVNGVLRPYELVAIMGASGSGKTSLLNTLTFRNTRNLTITGDRKINGVPLSREILSCVSVYVQQDDLFIGTMTVREHLMFQANLRMPKHTVLSNRIDAVENILQEFGLLKCANTVIGVPGRVKGISGGEMKRLSLASEVLDDPSLMFCDEPTSGLDSFTSETVISVLKTMASKGKTIVCTIHQPSSQVYSMFDRILLIADGRTAYLGNCSDAVEFFDSVGYAVPANFNPSDFFIQTLAIEPGHEAESRREVLEICDQYEESQFALDVFQCIHESDNSRRDLVWIKNSVSFKASEKVPFLTQLKTVLWRSWVNQIRDPMLFNMRLGSTIFISVLFGVIFLQLDKDQEGISNFNGAIFLFVVNMSFENSLSVVNAFCSEMPIILRENLSGIYRIDVYFLAKTTAEMPFCVIFPLLFTSIVYWMVGLNHSAERFFMAVVVFILLANVGASFGYLISCFSPSVSVATSMVSVFMMPLLLFGGFFLNPRDVPQYLKWIKYISWFFYGNEALLINQWKDVKDIECTNEGIGACVTTGNQVLKNLHYDEDHLIFDLVMLIVLLTVLRVMAFLSLLLKTHELGSLSEMLLFVCSFMLMTKDSEEFSKCVVDVFSD